MRESKLQCSVCQAECSKWDSYCGMCGANRVQLKGGYQQQSERVVIFLSEEDLQDDAFEIVLSSQFQNRLFAKLLRPQKCPMWISATALEPYLQKSFYIGLNAEPRIRMTCHPMALQRLKQQFHSGSWNTQDLGLELRFLFASGQPSADRKWSHRELVVYIQLDLGVDCTPRGSIYPLLPITGQASVICMHPITFTNYSRHSVRIRLSRFQNSPDDIEPLGYPFESHFQALTGEAERIGALEVLEPPAEKNLMLGPLDQKTIEVGIREPVVYEGDSDTGLPQWFAAELIFQLSYSNRRNAQKCIQLSGTLAEPPQLTWCPERHGPNIRASNEDHRIWINSKDAIFTRHLNLYVSNPGALPVILERIESFWLHEADFHQSELSLDEAHRIHPAEDWLSWETDSTVDMVLAPRTVRRELRLMIDPAKRLPHEDRQRIGYRCIRIHHNGAGPSPLELRLSVELGERKRLKNHVLLIDFGTSNSVVAILDRQQNKVQQLDIEPARPELNQKSNSLMPSVMFFLPEQHSGHDFLYGRSVYGSWRGHYGNVIRSMKSIMENRDEVYRFQYFNELLQKECQSQFKLQEILNRFIQELKIRGEQAYAHHRASEEGVSYGLIEEAIFTHPVDISPEAAEALFIAQKSAGLNPDIHTVDDFLARRCIDESTASLINVLFEEAHSEATEVIQEAVMSSASGLDVVCIDMGGGTSNVVCANLALSEDESICIRILSREGAAFGGDHIDRLIAKRIIEQMFAAEPQRIERRIFEDAIQCTTIQGFLHRSMVTAGTGIPHETLEDIWLESIMMLTKSERLKRQLDHDIDLLYSMRPDEARFSSQHESITSSRIELDKSQLRSDIEHGLNQSVYRVLEQALAGANWPASAPKALIFTGQTTKMELIRAGCERHLTGLDLIISASPEQFAFEPKQCVARGAGYFDINRASLSLEQTANEILNYHFQRKAGFGFRNIDGLAQGVSFSAHAVGEVSIRNPTDNFPLYRSIDKGRNKAPAVLFAFEKEVSGTLTITLLAADHIQATIGDVTVRGQIMLEGGRL